MRQRLQSAERRLYDAVLAYWERTGEGLTFRGAGVLVGVHPSVAHRTALRCRKKGWLIWGWGRQRTLVPHCCRDNK